MAIAVALFWWVSVVFNSQDMMGVFYLFRFGLWGLTALTLCHRSAFGISIESACMQRSIQPSSVCIRSIALLRSFLMECPYASSAFAMAACMSFWFGSIIARSIRSRPKTASSRHRSELANSLQVIMSKRLNVVMPQISF